MSKAWQDGELLHTLWSERRWRLNGYQPVPLAAGGTVTISDAANIETDLNADRIFGVRQTPATVGRHTNESLHLMDLVASGHYP